MNEKTRKSENEGINALLEKVYCYISIFSLCSFSSTISSIESNRFKLDVIIL